MGIIFHDTFVDAGGTDLDAHVPDTIGSSWTFLYNTLTQVIEIVGASSTVKPADSAFNQGALFSANPAPTVADVDIEAHIANLGTGQTDTICLVARYIDTNNYYAVLISNSSRRIQLHKVVSGNGQALGASTVNGAAGDIVKFELRGTALKVYVDKGSGYVLEISAIDSAIVDAGKAALGWGEISLAFSGYDLDGLHEVSEFKVTEFPGGLVITPGTANAVASQADPVVQLGAIAFVPDSASAVAEKIEPAVVLGGVTMTPSDSFALTNKVDPLILLGLNITPDPAFTVWANVDPSVVLGPVVFTPGSVTAFPGRLDPSIILGPLSFSPSPASALIAKNDPLVALGQIILTPSSGFVIAEGIDPTVTGGGGITVIPLPGFTLSGKADPSVILGALAINPSQAFAVVSKADPNVILGAFLINPQSATAVVSKTEPEVVLGGVLLSPLPGEAFTGRLDPAVVLGGLNLIPTSAFVFGLTLGPNVLVGGAQPDLRAKLVITDVVVTKCTLAEFLANKIKINEEVLR